jgi:PAS domain S-box-containing protein
MNRTSGRPLRRAARAPRRRGPGPRPRRSSPPRSSRRRRRHRPGRGPGSSCRCPAVPTAGSSRDGRARRPGAARRARRSAARGRRPRRGPRAASGRPAAGAGPGCDASWGQVAQRGGGCLRSPRLGPRAQRPIRLSVDTQGRSEARIAWTAEVVSVVEGVKFVVATGSETTRGKRAAQEFAETEARYETLLDLLPEAVAVHQDGRIVFVNRAAASLYGSGDPAELLGLGVWDFVAPSQRDAVRGRAAGILEKGGAIGPSLERHVRRDGTEIDVEVAAKPVVFNGRPAMEVITRDVSARVAEEQARAKAEARMRGIFDDSSIGMMLADRAGRSLESNPAYRRLLGYEQSELANLSVHDYTHENDREASRRALSRPVRGASRCLPARQAVHPQGRESGLGSGQRRCGPGRERDAVHVRRNERGHNDIQGTRGATAPGLEDGGIWADWRAASPTISTTCSPS